MLDPECRAHLDSILDRELADVVRVGTASRWHLPPCLDDGGHAIVLAVRVRGRGAGTIRSRPGMMSHRGAQSVRRGSLGRIGLTTGFVVVALACTVVTAAAQVPARTAGSVRRKRDRRAGGDLSYRPFGRFIYGDHYRDLWTAPLKAPVLSLDQYAGGLRPLERGGSQQTKSLRFSGADGREYVFRSIDKDPSPSLPPELRGTYAKPSCSKISSAPNIPGGSLVVARLLDAAGVLHVTPQLAVMPDDPRLGEFRQEFAGMLGLIELRPTGDPDEAISEGTGMTKVSELGEVVRAYHRTRG